MKCMIGLVRGNAFSSFSSGSQSSFEGQEEKTHGRNTPRFSAAKRTFAVWLFLLLAVMGHAAEITASRAAAAAGNWVKRSPHPLDARIGQTVRGTQTYKDNADNALFHVVRFAEGGFVVTSADDGVKPVIAFSSDDDLVADARNPFWILLNLDLPQRLAAAKAQVDQRQLDGAALTVDSCESEWRVLLSDNTVPPKGLSKVSDLRVSPLVSSKWDQSKVDKYDIYNYYTPDHAVCGCVATAGSQIMRYHQWPVASVPAGKYPCSVEGKAVDLTMKGGRYSWADMPLEPSSSITLEQRQAIGKLTYDVGVASHMSYTPTNSGANPYNLAKAFTDRFGYATARFMMDSSGVDGCLPQTALPNLDAGFPVAFGIHGKDEKGDTIGHAVVGDGYGYSGGTRYVHLNMGWSGTNDAWYNIPDISTKVKFSILSSVIYNIFPDRTGEIISGRVLDDSGNPMVGASVVVTDMTAGATLPAVTSNAMGIYAVIVPEPTSPSTHSYRVKARSGSLSGEQNITVSASVSTAASYNESTGVVKIEAGTGVVGNRWGVNLTVSESAASQDSLMKIMQPF